MNLIKRNQWNASFRTIGLLCLLFIFIGCGTTSFLLKTDTPPGMVYIPPGWFQMGSLETDGLVGMAIGIDELPRHRVYVNSFFIDRFEVTNRKFLKYLLEIKSPYRPSTWKNNGLFKEGEGDHPVVDVDWNDANAYCQWHGKRLPEEVEWEKAARGDDGRLWPWGNEFRPGIANTLEADVGWTSPVGSFPDDVSPYGIYDMAGNVREWTAGWYAFYPNAPNRSSITDSLRVLRGGSFLTPNYRFARTASRYPVNSSLATRGHNWHSNTDHGFRCVKEAR